MASHHSDEDTLAPMQGPTGRRSLATVAAGVGARRPTLSLGAGGPRKSLALGLLSRGSVSHFGRRSKAHGEQRYYNTYRLQPKPDERLATPRVSALAQEALEESLAFYSYSPGTAPTTAVKVAECIRDRVKEAGFDRYKFVVSVVLVPLANEASVTVGSRGVWATDCGDSFVEARLQTKSVLAAATVYCFYYE